MSWATQWQNNIKTLPIFRLVDATFDFIKTNPIKHLQPEVVLPEPFKTAL